ncbi:hypothetical protein [Streptomyces sp. AK02-01A]|uniref:hypothetical protein n=1 Tax=Streptomyces sp. AK02-01A TaxID=3028648 RepID=UPI0029BB2650|nr:hypothetical protein [Streptomyces sp. AK02-01A]MDX3854065.1 hypothetical protein [Streptomyces sp. AK02-01A]
MSGRKDRHGFGRGGGREDGQAGPDAPLNDLTGNGIVNNGPENELGGLGDTGAGRDSGSGPGESLGRGLGGILREGPGGDEPDLRRLFQSAVEDLEPSDGALDRLRKAVPARRARKRQAVVGMAAAAILFGTAVPAFVHVANSGGASDAHPVNAGHGEQAQGGTGAGKDTGDGEKGAGVPSGGESAAQDDAGEKDKPDGDTANSSDGGTGVPSKPGDAYTASSPRCAASQLGVTTAEASAPGADGKVYGVFRVANVSGTDCSVTGGGSISFQPTGAADAARISVVAHTTGDAATGLPDPSAEVSALVLAPSSAYEVKFAWVPTNTCPTSGASPDPTPSDDASGVTGGSAAGSGAGSGTDASNAETQMVNDGTVDGSVSVSHTAEPGAPVAQATIPNACAGTIYRTGVLNAP